MLVAEDGEAFEVKAAPAFVDVVLVLNVLTEEDVDGFFEDDVIFDDDVGVDVDDDEGAAFGAVEKNVTDPVAKMELCGIPDGKDETSKFCSSNFCASLMVNSPTGLSNAPMQTFIWFCPVVQVSGFGQHQASWYQLDTVEATRAGLLDPPLLHSICLLEALEPSSHV